MSGAVVGSIFQSLLLDLYPPPLPPVWSGPARGFCLLKERCSSAVTRVELSRCCSQICCFVFFEHLKCRRGESALKLESECRLEATSPLHVANVS